MTEQHASGVTGSALPIPQDELLELEFGNNFKALVTFSLTQDARGQGLRNNIRNALRSRDVHTVGTTLYLGDKNPEDVETELLQLIVSMVDEDDSPATLTNLQVFVFGYRRVSVPGSVLNELAAKKAARLLKQAMN